MPPRPPAPSRPRALPALLASAVAFALYALSPQAHVFSDGINLVHLVEGGPHLYYHLLYVPLGWAFHRALLSLLGWSVFEALRWLSIVCAAAAAGMVTRLAARAGEEPPAQLAWGLLFAVTPGVWFFAETVEVHAVQVLGAAVATELALVARERRTRAALGLVAGAAALAVASHLSAVLFLPALVWLAGGAEPGRGLPLARLARPRGIAAALGVVVVGAGLLWLLATRAPTWPFLRPARALVSFADVYVQRLFGQPLFGPGEVAAYFQSELLWPAGLLFPAALFGLLVRGRRRAALGLLVVLVPYFLAFFQSGLREAGAYVMTYLPLFAWLAAGTAATLRARRGGSLVGPLLVLSIAVQSVLGWQHQRSLHEGRDARDWIAEVERLAPPKSVLVTVSLPRWHAMSFSPAKYEGTDLFRSFQLAPFSQAEDVARQWLSLIAADVLAGKPTFLDAEIVDTDGDPPYFRVFRRVLAGIPARLVPVLDSKGKPILYQVLAADPPAR